MSQLKVNVFLYFKVADVNMPATFQCILFDVNKMYRYYTSALYS